MLGRCSEFVQLAAALAPSRCFFPIIVPRPRHSSSLVGQSSAGLGRGLGVRRPAQVLARSLAAFSGTSGSRVGGAIPPAFMRKEKADRKEIELIHARPL